MCERLCVGIDKAVLEGPETGRGVRVMPPRLTSQITQQEANLFSRNKVAERECVLTWLWASKLLSIDVATVAPQTLTLIRRFAAGVLTPTAQASHIRPDQVNTPLRGKKAIFCRVNENTSVDQWQTIAVGKVVHHIPSFRVIDTTYNQICISSEAISSLVAYGQRKSPNHKLRRSRDPANVSSSKINLTKTYGKTVSISEAIKIVRGNIVMINDRYLFEAHPSQRLEDQGPNAPGTNHADVGAGKAGLSQETPAI